MFVKVLHWSLFWYSFLLCPRFAIILTRKRVLVVLLLLSLGCLVSVNDLWLFLTVSWFGLQFLCVISPDRTYLLLGSDDHFNLIILI